MSINHDQVAEKGYKQTGPTMPLEGPVAPTDVFPNLLEVLQEIDPTSTPLEVALSRVREDSTTFVKEGIRIGKWKT